MNNKEDYLHHKCTLPSEFEILKHDYPGETFKERYCRGYTKYITINFDNPRARRMFRSRDALSKEKKRHIKLYKSTFHPFSAFRMHWECYMAIVYILAMISTCTNVMFVYCGSGKHDEKIVPFVQFDIIMCLFSFVDIPINFNTGYVSTKSNEVVLNNWSIFKHYLFSFLIVDFLTSIPIEYLLPVFLINCEKCDAFALLRFAKYLRMFTLEKYFKRTFENIGLHEMVGEVLWVLLRFVLFVLLVAAVQFLVGEVQVSLEDGSWVQLEEVDEFRFEESFFRASCNMLTIGYGVSYPETLEDQIVFLASTLTGSLFTLLSIGKMLQWINIMNASSSKYEEMVQNLKYYMRRKELPMPLQTRIVEYYEFRYQKTYFKEPEILFTLPTQLRQEIILHSCRRLVENVSFFSNLPGSLLLRIVVCLRGEMFLANDVIVKVGAVGDCMYFLTSGTVAVYTSSGKEVCHLEDGAHFGEIALVHGGQLRVASVVAIECCELYRLDERDFVRAISPFPDLMARVQRVAEERLERTAQIEDRGRRRA